MASLAIPIEKLPDAVLGRDPAYARPEAMAQLAFSARPDRESLLAQVLQNDKEPRRYKAVAAIALGRIPTPSAEATLLSRLSKTSDPAFPEVLLSLGRIGGPQALVAIDSLQLPPLHPDAGRAAYAASLIAHRLGLPGHELPFPPEENILKPPAAGQSRPVEFAPVDHSAAQLVLDGMNRYPYGIAFEPTKLTSARCAGEINVICPNREFLGATATRLAERKAVLALVALQSPETAEYSISYVVLSRPSTGKVGTLTITVHRCSGKLALAGSARLAGTNIQFELRSVRQPGAWATSLTGSLEDGRVQMTEAISSTIPEKRLQPTRKKI